MKNNFTFLHISDLHLAKKSNCQHVGQYAHENGIRRAFLDIHKIKEKGYERTLFTPTTYDAEILNTFQEAIDEILQEDPVLSETPMILLTGDIATTASNKNLRTAKDILTSEINYENLTDALIPSYINNTSTYNIYDFLYLLPGNHDRFCIKPGNNFFKQGLETFSEYFYEKWEKHERISVEEFDDFIMIFADFSLPEGFYYRQYENCDNKNTLLTKEEKDGSFYGKGIYTVQLKEELEGILEKIQDLDIDNKKILFISHFALITDDADLELINSEMLIETLNKYNITNFFCGHTHEVKYDTIGNIQHICCGSTLGCSMNDDFSFLKHSIYKDNEKYVLETIEYEYIYSDTYGYFHEKEPRKCII